jgi:hypothetical protein
MGNDRLAITITQGAHMHILPLKVSESL